MRNASLVFGATNEANDDEKLNQSTEQVRQQDCIFAPQRQVGGWAQAQEGVENGGSKVAHGMVADGGAAAGRGRAPAGIKSVCRPYNLSFIRSFDR